MNIKKLNEEIKELLEINEENYDDIVATFGADDDKPNYIKDDDEIESENVSTYDTFFTDDENSDEYYEGTLEITKHEDGTYSYYETSTGASGLGFKTEDEAIQSFREFAEGGWEIVEIG